MFGLALVSLCFFESLGHIETEGKSTEVWFYLFSNTYSKAVAFQSAPTNAVKCWQHPDWTARIPGADWIWSTFKVTSETGLETIHFINEFVVEGEISSAHLDIAADSSVWVRVNGVDTDCIKIGGSFTIQSQFTCDVTKYVEKELNDIEFKVMSSHRNAEENAAGLLYRMTIKTLV